MNNREMERWASVTAGALLAAAGVKRGGRTGALMSLAGSALGVGAYFRFRNPRSVFETAGEREWAVPRERLEEDARVFGRPGHHDGLGDAGDDAVLEASDESFPASDPPSFTPNTSLGRHEPR